VEPDDPGGDIEQILGVGAVIFSPSEVLPIAASTGFRAEMIEKVLHLLNLLDQLNRHPMLKGKWVLKGGTALNLFVFDLTRLSVDIDINYVGALEREAMLTERPKVEQAAQAVFSREGFTTKRVPTEHAGGKWRLSYQSYTGQNVNLEVDLNFMFRQPLSPSSSSCLDATPALVYETNSLDTSLCWYKENNLGFFTIFWAKGSR
jgi:predicted nucleotidyltransferase component of viral defense system